MQYPTKTAYAVSVFRAMTMTDLVKHYTIYGHNPYDTAKQWAKAATEYDMYVCDNRVVYGYQD